MRRPPRPPEQPLFTRALVVWGLVQGSLALAIVATAFVIANVRDMPESEMRALCFFTLVAAIISLIFVNRSFSASFMDAVARPSPVLLLVLALVGSALAACLSVPAVADVFRFGTLHADDLAFVAAGAALLIGTLEGVKFMLGARGRSPA
jgi:Ca2+-transporting ATPase